MCALCSICSKIPVHIVCTALQLAEELPQRNVRQMIGPQDFSTQTHLFMYTSLILLQQTQGGSETFVMLRDAQHNVSFQTCLDSAGIQVTFNCHLLAATLFSYGTVMLQKVFDTQV